MSSDSPAATAEVVADAAPAVDANNNAAAAKPKKEKKPKAAAASSASADDKKVVVPDATPFAVKDPEFLAHRVAMWDAIKTEQAAQPKEQVPIKVTLPNGSVVDGISNVTTPLDIANGISKGLAARMLVATVNGKVWDLHRPLETDSELILNDFPTPDGKYTFWHSSAHILGQALELQFGVHLCIGPPTEDGGFYYDCFMPDGSTLSQRDYEAIEQHVNKIIKDKQNFERLVLTKQQALDMFKHNPFKVEIISSKIPDGETVTAYRCGPLIDLCRGPHVPNTSLIKAMAITKSSASYWGGKADNASLQRVYGISFPDKAQLKEYQRLMEEAAKRDHRKIGQDQSLFLFHPLSPGSCFFLPHGARIYNSLIELMRKEYRRRGFSEVVTPNVFNTELWAVSGHLQNYKEHMFVFKCEDQDFGMKPMNCPGHCLMFGSKKRSYRELPLRLADFGVLHRNEFSGALHGLTRVRRFQQDDAHIFCMPEQIEQEIAGALDFLQYIYGIFGFEYSLALSTRPEKFLGEVETWDAAEKSLTDCLNKSGKEWKLNPGDGAFYGPKIDIHVYDALKRKHQCATIQLDFQLPIRFKLQYVTENQDFKRPVIIHRAILGSVERMFAILCEHTAGKWPFWLSPRQAVVVPISEKFFPYAQTVRDALWNEGFYVDLDDSNHTVSRKVLDGQMEGYNFILVVGQKEMETNTVNVRLRDEQPQAQQHEEMTPLPELIAKFHKLRDSYDNRVGL